ncbi:MAG: triose-phosphate isomerase [Desulfurococcales archaeon]|nr:triose-phosphate isomerase [Desulfurococcales archaeon]
MKPILVVNYKAYPSSHGEPAARIAEKAAELASTHNVRIILAVPATEVYRLSKIHDDIFIQGVKPVPQGAYTGSITVEMAVSAGARGILLNHSENKMLYRDIQHIIQRTSLETLVCAETPEEAAAVSMLKPSMIAVEPPELIGTGIPVSKAKPEIIINTVELVRKHNPDIPILTGAGISEPDDAVKALQLGSQGILVASSIMKASQPEAKLEQFTEALEKTVNLNAS